MNIPQSIVEKVVNGKTLCTQCSGVIPDLSISRIPKETLQRFKQLAKDEFAYDYGMCLKALFDYWERGEMIEYLFARVERLEQQSQPTEEKPRKIKFLGKKEEQNEQIKPISRQEQDI